MPVSAATPTLTNGFLSMFEADTAPETTKEAADRWAQVYTDFLVAGGLIVPAVRTASLKSALRVAFDPTLAGGGPALFLQALTAFFMVPPPSVYPVAPLPTDTLVPQQIVPPVVSATVLSFVPANTNMTLGLPDTATTRDQANALATLIASLTLSSTIVQLATAVGASPSPLL